MTQHNICDECETVAHCSNHGCIPKQKALDMMADNARELGLGYEPVAKDNTNYRLDPPAPDPLYTQRKPLTNTEIHTAYIAATNQTLRPQDERIVFAFTRAIEDAHGIKE